MEMTRPKITIMGLLGLVGLLACFWFGINLGPNDTSPKRIER